MKLTTSKYYIPSGRCIQKLDYTHKVNGKAEAIADSLKRIFYTSNKRLVKDGEGITPDFKTPESKLNKITSSLISKYIIFDFATNYRNLHPSITVTKKFNLTDQDFQDFLSFANGKDYAYNTDAEDALETFKKESTKENYFSGINAEYDALFEKLKQNKTNDILKYKEEIMQVLEEEIASRYYFEKARIEASFDNDIDIEEAISILSNASKYNAALAGK